MVPAFTSTTYAPGGFCTRAHNVHTVCACVHLLCQRAGSRLYGIDSGPKKLNDFCEVIGRHLCGLCTLTSTDAEADNTIILTDELDRGSTSFTVDTLEQLRIQLNESATMRLLIGGDQLQLFDQWKNSERIIELAEPVVMVRPPQSRSSLLKSLPKGYNSAQWAMRLVDVPAMAISSTIVRQLVSQAQPIDELVAPAVKAYIREHALYQGKMPRTL